MPNVLPITAAVLLLLSYSPMIIAVTLTITLTITVTGYNCYQMMLIIAVTWIYQG